MIGRDPTDLVGNGPYNEPRAGDLKSQVKEAVRDARVSVQDFTRYLRTHDTSEIRSDLEQRVREHPFASVAIGLGIGFLIGKMVR